MPRLLPQEWIRQKAINYLIERYKRKSDFMREWDQIRNPYCCLLKQYAKVFTLYQMMDIAIKVPHDLVRWEIDHQRVEKYLGGLPPPLKNSRDLHELLECLEPTDNELVPYKEKLRDLTYRWRMRADWAPDELFYDDIGTLQSSIFRAAGVTAINKLSEGQVVAYLRHSKPSGVSISFPVNVITLYTEGGRQGTERAFARYLAHFETALKHAGMKEVPSSLEKHANWWFEHYVNGRTYVQLENQFPQARESIKRAVWNFSKSLEIRVR